ncbi:MAG: CoA transferase, partial [Gammaproteobacteria bacterium]|nr:CoA transferase [Gammaproteobacteria bacterium]
MKDSALSGIKVVEYSQEISGPYCARQLADFGAAVIKVEDIEGDSSRKIGPFPGDVPDIEQSGLFLAVNTNKFGMTLNLKDRAGREVFKELIQQADVLVENNLRTAMTDLGLDYETLHQLNPRLIYVSVTPFGHTGCYRDYIADELVLAQMSGIGYYTPGDADEPHQPPLRAGARLSDVSAGTCAATATMFALLQRQSSGEGQHIDVASRETPMFAGIYNMALYFYERQKPTRFGGKMPREPSR